MGIRRTVGMHTSVATATRRFPARSSRPVTWSRKDARGPQVTDHIERWLQCTNCGHGSIVFGTEVIPGALFGPKIEVLPNDVADAYLEARRCMSVVAYTSAELICRKVLMQVAVEKGAREGDSFANYLSYLESLDRQSWFPGRHNGN
jgi:hypothetical protein